MVKKRRVSTKIARAPLKPLQTGQVWELGESNLQIGLLGKTLVHYKHYRAKVKRAPVSLTSKVALSKYLQDRNAILIQE